MSSPSLAEAASALIPTLPPAVACTPGAATPGAVRHIYVTSVGDGPRVLPTTEALADAETGLPFTLAAAHDGAFDKAL